MERVSGPRNHVAIPLMLNLHHVRSFENSSAPFNIEEHDAVYKMPKYYPWNFNEYQDFKVNPGFLYHRDARTR